LLGSCVTRHFLDKGVGPVKALVRANSDLSHLEDIPDKVQWARGDILDQVGLEKYIDEGDTVIHCAAMVSYDQKDKMELFRVNVEGTKNVVNVCLKKGAAKLIHVSSIASFGMKNPGEAVTEDHKKNPAALKSNYALSKYLAEMEVWRGNIEGLNAVMINPSVIIGPAGWNNSSVKLFRYVWNENLFFIDGAMNCVDARDVAEIVYRLYEGDFNGQQFIVSAERIAYKDLFEKIAKGFNKKPPRIKVPRAALGVVSVLDRVRRFVTGGRPVITTEIKRAAKGSIQFSSEKVRKELGVDFRSIEDAIQWTCDELIRYNDRRRIKAANLR